jgi:hypothetical protein
MEKNKKHEPITMGEIQNFLLQDGWERITEDLFNIPGLNHEEIVEHVLECNPDNMWCDDRLTSEEMVKLISRDLIDSRITHEDLVNECRTWGWRRSDYYFTKDDTTIFFVFESNDEEKELQNDWFWCETTSGDRLLINEHLYFFSDLIQKIKDSEFDTIRQQKINEHKQMIKELETLK